MEIKSGIFPGEGIIVEDGKIFTIFLMGDDFRRMLYG
jgi:hypothetical protein